MSAGQAKITALLIYHFSLVFCELSLFSVAFLESFQIKS